MVLKQFGMTKSIVADIGKVCHEIKQGYLASSESPIFPNNKRYITGSHKFDLQYLWK